MIAQSRPDLTPSDFAYIGAILRTGQVAKGRLVEGLERAFRRSMKTKYAAAVSSGTASLHLALSALGIRPGDEVVAPSYTCASVLCAIQHTGARVRFVDIEADTLNISHRTVSERLTRRAKAVIVTHTFGFPAPLRELLSLGVPVVEDCATALGATYQGRPVGSWGACSIVSLYATKMICAGEGGMVCTNDARVIRRVRDVSDPGQRAQWRLRYNYKLSDLAAGLALSQLRRLPRMLARRRAIAARYRRAFADCPVQMPRALPGTNPTYYRFIIASPRADAIIRRARRAGIGCDRPVCRPLHRYAASAPGGKFPHTDAVFRSAVSIPIYPALSDEQIDRIITRMQRILVG